MLARKFDLKFSFGQTRHLPIEPSNLAIVVALSVATIVLLAAFVPAGQVLPIFSLGAFAASVVSGIMAYIARHGRGGKELAAAFMLLGCVAGMLSGPDQVLQLFGIAQVDP